MTLAKNIQIETSYNGDDYMRNRFHMMIHFRTFSNLHRLDIKCSLPMLKNEEAVKAYALSSIRHYILGGPYKKPRKVYFRLRISGLKQIG